MDLEPESAAVCGWSWNVFCYLVPRGDGGRSYHVCALAPSHAESCRCGCGTRSPYGPPPADLEDEQAAGRIVEAPAPPTAAQLDEALRLPPGTVVFEQPAPGNTRLHMVVRVEPAGPNRWRVFWSYPDNAWKLPAAPVVEW